MMDIMLSRFECTPSTRDNTVFTMYENSQILISQTSKNSSVVHGQITGNIKSSHNQTSVTTVQKLHIITDYTVYDMTDLVLTFLTPGLRVNC